MTPLRGDERIKSTARQRKDFGAYTVGRSPVVCCANAFRLGVEAINDPMGSNQRP